ncbi:MAG: hypothetical protein QOJ76_354 [Acidobacteriota bacterium]|nr:hypothetical protein [Acidobacteriota bacterium]
MPTWMKVMFIVGGLLVMMLVLAVVGGFYVARTYGPQFVETSKRSIEEGREFGQRTDNEGCVKEAVARRNRSDGFVEMVKSNLFLPACLEASRPTPGFCDDVPHPTDFMKGMGWQLKQCKHYGLTPEKQCAQLFQVVQQFCEEHRTAPAGKVDEGNAPPTQPPPPPPAPRESSHAR